MLYKKNLKNQKKEQCLLKRMVICMCFGQVNFDPGKSNFGLPVRMGKLR